MVVFDGEKRRFIYDKVWSQETLRQVSLLLGVWFISWICRNIKRNTSHLAKKLGEDGKKLCFLDKWKNLRVTHYPNIGKNTCERHVLKFTHLMTLVYHQTYPIMADIGSLSITIGDKRRRMQSWSTLGRYYSESTTICNPCCVGSSRNIHIEEIRLMMYRGRVSAQQI